MRIAAAACPRSRSCLCRAQPPPRLHAACPRARPLRHPHSPRHPARGHVPPCRDPPLQPAAVGFHRVSSGSGSDGSSGAEGAPQAAHRKLHGGAAARARVGEAGAVNAKGGAGARSDDVEREKLVLNQARVRLGAQVLAPFEGGGLRGCVVRKKAPEKKDAGDREGRGKMGVHCPPGAGGLAGGVGLKGGGRNADYFGTLVGESKVLCVCSSVRACAPACLRARARACARACLRACSQSDSTRFSETVY